MLFSDILLSVSYYKATNLIIAIKKWLFSVGAKNMYTDNDISLVYRTASLYQIAMFWHRENANLVKVIICDDAYIHLTQVLTHWGRDKMAAIFQTTSPSGFSWMKMYEFRLTLHWSLFLGVQLTIFQHWLRWWLGADQATSHYLNQWWLDYRRIYASLGLNEFKCPWIFAWWNWPVNVIKR